jgi:hypothetical protein
VTPWDASFPWYFRWIVTRRLSGQGSRRSGGEIRSIEASRAGRGVETPAARGVLDKHADGTLEGARKAVVEGLPRGSAVAAGEDSVGVGRRIEDVPALAVEDQAEHPGIALKAETAHRLEVVDALLASPRDFGWLLEALGAVAAERVERITAARLGRA